MTTTDIIRIIVDREKEWTRRRNTALARGNWGRAIECEAALTVLSNLRNEIADSIEKETNDVNPTP